MGRTITVSDELYERLRREAARSKVSVASLVRTRLEQSPAPKKPGKRGKDPLSAVMGIYSPVRLAENIDPILSIAGTCQSKAELASNNIDKHLYGT